jgi:hypothetical protein
MKTDIKTINVTIDSQMYNQLLDKFEINNQDELDACISSFIQDKLLEIIILKETLDEYSSKNPYKTIKSLQNDLENPMWS